MKTGAPWYHAIAVILLLNFPILLAPIVMPFLSPYDREWVLPIAFGMLPLVWICYLALVIRVRSFLKLRGYDWITFNQAARLYATAGRRVWRVPYRVDIETAPDYVEGDLDALIALLYQCCDG